MKTFLLTVVLSTLGLHAALAGDAKAIKVGAFTFMQPRGSVIVPPWGTEEARLAIGQDRAAVGVIFFISGRGGTTASGNVAEWFREFSDDSVREVHTVYVGNVKVSYAAIEGTLLPRQGYDARRDWALYGAILENPSGDVFVKMAGPRATVKANEGAFRSMVSDAASTAVTKKARKKT